MPITLTLPYPPSVNKYWRHARTRGGKVVTHVSNEGKAYQEKALQHIRRQLGFGIKPLIGHLILTAQIYPPNYVVRDLDNCLKAVQDAITHAKVWVDDSQVHELHLAWGEVRKGGMVLVEISEMAPEEVKFIRPEKPAKRKGRKRKD